jgi:hypothetical protein
MFLGANWMPFMRQLPAQTQKSLKALASIHQIYPDY